MPEKTLHFFALIGNTDGNYSFENSTNLWKYDMRHMYLNNKLVQNLEHINILLEHWAQLFEENLGTRQLAQNLGGTLLRSTLCCSLSFLLVALAVLVIYYATYGLIC